MLFTAQQCYFLDVRAKLYIYLWARQNKKTDDSFADLQSIANELANGEMPPQEFIYTEALLSSVKWMEGLLEIEKTEKC